MRRFLIVVIVVVVVGVEIVESNVEALPVLRLEDNHWSWSLVLRLLDLLLGRAQQHELG